MRQRFNEEIRVFLFKKLGSRVAVTDKDEHVVNMSFEV